MALYLSGIGQALTKFRDELYGITSDFSLIQQGALVPTSVHLNYLDKLKEKEQLLYLFQDAIDKTHTLIEQLSQNNPSASQDCLGMKSELKEITQQLNSLKSFGHSLNVYRQTLTQELQELDRIALFCSQLFRSEVCENGRSIRQVSSEIEALASRQIAIALPTLTRINHPRLQEFTAATENLHCRAFAQEISQADINCEPIRRFKSLLPIYSSLLRYLNCFNFQSEQNRSLIFVQATEVANKIHAILDSCDHTRGVKLHSDLMEADRAHLQIIKSIALKTIHLNKNDKTLEDMEIFLEQQIPLSREMIKKYHAHICEFFQEIERGHLPLFEQALLKAQNIQVLSLRFEAFLKIYQDLEFFLSNNVFFASTNKRSYQLQLKKTAQELQSIFNIQKQKDAAKQLQQLNRACFIDQEQFRNANYEWFSEEDLDFLQENTFPCSENFFEENTFLETLSDQFSQENVIPPNERDVMTSKPSAKQPDEFSQQSQCLSNYLSWGTPSEQLLSTKMFNSLLNVGIFEKKI